MPSLEPRSRLYDGRPYSLLLEPLLEGLHTFVAEQIPIGSTVLDVGCGTGALIRKMADQAERAVGIDLSPVMIEHARTHAARAGLDNVTFRVGDATSNLKDLEDGAFEHATLVLALHEMPAEIRAPLLREVVRVAGTLLCVDFRVPMPRNLAGLRNRTFEFLAGLEHFRAFRDFTRRGGLGTIAKEAGVAFEHQRFIDGKTIEVATLRRLGAK